MRDEVLPLTSDGIYQECSDLVGNETEADILKCVTSKLLEQDLANREFSRTLNLIICSSLAFFMQAGFAMLCAGAVRRKNVQNTMLKNLLDACGAAIAFFCVGYAFAFGDGDNPNSFIGTQNFFLMNVPDYGFWIFQYSISAASTTIVAGTLAERCQMAAYFCYSFLLAGFVYPIIVHSIWSDHGFLSAENKNPLFGVGVVDFAGGGVVHTTGGMAALFATIVLGPRRGRFHDEEGRRLAKPRDMPGHSMALQMLGTLTLWFGWYGFNCGSALIAQSPERDYLAALAAINTTLAGGVAGVTSLFVNYVIQERLTGEPVFDLKMAMNGSLGGLVAITAGAGIVEPWAAVVVGIIGGLLYLGGTRLLLRLHLDDAVDAIPVHMFNGVWGMLAVGLFASGSLLDSSHSRKMPHVGFFYSIRDGKADAHLLAANIVGLLWIAGWVLIIMLPFFAWLDWKGWFRSDPLEEIVGLDTSYHGGLILAGGEEPVNPEYMSQFHQRKGELRNRRRNQTERAPHEEDFSNRFGDDEAEVTA